MKIVKFRYISGLLFSVITLSGHAAVLAEPSGIARLGYIDGYVSFRPVGETKWVKATLNRPLVTGDYIWSGMDSLSELQLDNATIQMGNQTSLNILNINRKISQLQVTSGSLILRVWRLRPNQTIEISTPNLAFTISRPGNYRVFVNSKANITQISVIQGSGKVYGAKKAFLIHAGQSCPFGGNLTMYRCTGIPAPDSFARWSLERERLRAGKSYVSSDMIGDEDLNRYGKWQRTQQYGNIWIPDNVNSNWAPYRTGQWVWIRHWGWTWVDEQPWGFAPFHYGRWVHIDRRWSWVPGPRDVAPVYAPALVVFVGGRNFDLGQRGSRDVAWFPLGPGEVYIPSWQASRDYFISVNSSNTRINRNYINNVYNNQNINITYQNINVINAVSAVPAQAFIQSQPVSQALVTVPVQTLVNAPTTQTASVVPDNASVLGSSEAAESQPSAAILDKPAVVTTEPPAPAIPFNDEKKLLAEDPGKPLTAQETEKLKPATQEGKQLEVVNPEQNAVPVTNELIEQSPVVQDPSVLEPPAATPKEPPQQQEDQQQLKQQEQQLQQQQEQQLKQQHEQQLQQQQEQQLKQQPEQQLQQQQEQQLKQQQEQQLQQQQEQQLKQQQEQQLQQQQEQQLKQQQAQQLQQQQEQQLKQQQEQQLQQQQEQQLKQQQEQQLQQQQEQQLKQQQEQQLQQQQEQQLKQQQEQQLQQQQEQQLKQQQEQQLQQQQEQQLKQQQEQQLQQQQEQQLKQQQQEQQQRQQQEQQLRQQQQQQEEQQRQQQEQQMRQQQQQQEEQQRQQQEQQLRQQQQQQEEQQRQQQEQQMRQQQEEQQRKQQEQQQQQNQQ